MYSMVIRLEFETETCTLCPAKLELPEKAVADDTTASNTIANDFIVMMMIQSINPFVAFVFVAAVQAKTKIRVRPRPAKKMSWPW